MLKLILNNITGNLPTSNFELIDGEKNIGKLQLRHTPSRSEFVPEGFENHIYYEIQSEFRMKGYGKQILKLGLDEARKIGLKKVILSCNDTNIASQKIIESNGGMLIDKKENTKGELIRKYEIKLL